MGLIIKQDGRNKARLKLSEWRHKKSCVVFSPKLSELAPENTK
jgi:hypothetical protein